MEQAIKSPINRQIEKTIGAETLHKMVCAVLRLYCESLNISADNLMSPVQVYEAAGFWLENNPFESLKDLILCLKRAKQGEYGKTFNRFDGEVFGIFWNKYLEQKIDYRAMLHRNQKSAEANNELGLIAQIEANSPGSMQRFMDRKREIQQGWAKHMTTPELTENTLENYIDRLNKALPVLDLTELARIKLEATAKNVPDVLELVVAEIARRGPESVKAVADTEKAYLQAKLESKP